MVFFYNRWWLRFHEIEYYYPHFPNEERRHGEVRWLVQYHKPWCSGFGVPALKLLVPSLAFLCPSLCCHRGVHLLPRGPTIADSRFHSLGQGLVPGALHDKSHDPGREKTSRLFIQPFTFCWDLVIILLSQMKGSSKGVFWKWSTRQALSREETGSVSCKLKLVLTGLKELLPAGS